jgi:hypothetical protein
VVVDDSVVGGNVQLKQGRAARVTGTDVNGDLQLEANTRALQAEGNVIDGNLQAFQNTGGLLVKHNRIDGNLQCKENRPAPRGGGNEVAGSAEDQCASLARPGAPSGGGGDGVTPPPAQPTCVYGAVTLGDGFTVPAGASCAMNGTRIAGTLALAAGSSLDAVGIDVDGNIQAQGASVLRVVGSTIDGSVQFEQGGAASVQRSRVALWQDAQASAPEPTIGGMADRVGHAT